MDLFRYGGDEFVMMGNRVNEAGAGGCPGTGQ